jgi:tetratricopeptide (TPR) repeat protein
MTKSNFYSLITFALAVFLFVGCASKVESQPETPETASVPELLQKADEGFRQRENGDKLREAIGFLKRARSADEKNFEAAWKLAQYSYFLGKTTKDDKEAEKVFAAGTSAGRVATNLGPDRPEGWFWLGAVHGGEAERFPFTKGLGNLDKIRGAMTKVIEIDPNYQGATAFDALATIELKTASFGGKPVKAVEYLQKGLELNPNNFMSRYNLAEAYLALDKNKEAKAQLDYLLKIKPSAELEPEYKEISGKARKMLETKF